MSYQKKLVGEKCYLAPCRAGDAEAWARWDTDLEVAIPMGSEAHSVYSEEKESEILRDIIAKQMPVFNIVTCDGDTLIGRCLLMHIDSVDRTAELGMVIGEKDHWSSGFGLEATRLLLDYAFNLLNLNSVMLGVFSFNKRAIRCYEKAGFKLIGRRREARTIAAKKYDLIFMDMLASEFESIVVRDLIEQ
jgi:RimJ/RimL family protein N-acetyltransferase